MKQDASAFTNYQKYDFNSWGWLSNEYLKKAGNVMPSWSLIKESIIEEEVS